MSKHPYFADYEILDFTVKENFVFSLATLQHGDTCNFYFALSLNLTGSYSFSI